LVAGAADTKANKMVDRMKSLTIVRRISMICMCVVLMLLASAVGAQQTIRVDPPGQLATLAPRDTDFSTVRFLGLQRDYRSELRDKLMIGQSVIRIGRPLLPMDPMVWPPEPVD